MLWFKKPKPELVVSPPQASRVEVELHKNANKEAVAMAKEVNTHLSNLLVENGFTIKIALAAGRKNIRGKGK